MSFLNLPVERNQLSQRTRQRRKKIALSLLDQFGQAFPEITYELLWESATINAQAWRLGSVRYVRVYGGLVRHPVITRSALALTIAHETGHHLGGPPCDPGMPWLAWQGQADYWAARTAMPRVFGSRAQTMTLRGGLQILKLHQVICESLGGDDPDLSAYCRYSIFQAGVANIGIPACAKVEYQECFDRNYPEIGSSNFQK